MRERIEAMIREYPQKKLELDCLKNQIQNFRGISENDMIDSMVFSKPDGERVANSSISDKTASVGSSYRERMERMNAEWRYHLESRYCVLAEEITFFESALMALQGKPGKIMRDIVLSGMTQESVAERYYLSRTTIWRYQKQAVDKLIPLYEQHEADVLAFMLG